MSLEFVVIAGELEVSYMRKCRSVPLETALSSHYLEEFAMSIGEST